MWMNEWKRGVQRVSMCLTHRLPNPLAGFLTNPRWEGLTMAPQSAAACCRVLQSAVACCNTLPLQKKNCGTIPPHNTHTCRPADRSDVLLAWGSWLAPCSLWIDCQAGSTPCDPGVGPPGAGKHRAELRRPRPSAARPILWLWRRRRRSVTGYGY
jgi:hypothetical protein